MLKGMLTAVALTMTASAALAQTASFYIVQDAHTKKCTIVDKKPVTQETVVVGDGKIYTSRTEGAMKTVKVCTN